MSNPVTEWLEGQADRVLQQQRATVENSKLVATFVAAIAATLAATALQVGDPGLLDALAAIGVAATVLTAFRVIRTDRLDVADHEAIIVRASSQTPPWTPDRTLQELQDAMLTAVGSNFGVVEGVRAALVVNLWSATATSAVSLISLLLPLLKPLIEK